MDNCVSDEWESIVADLEILEDGLSFLIWNSLSAISLSSYTRIDVNSVDLEKVG